MPRRASELTFAETVKLLMELFSTKRSLFHKRWRCLNLTRKEGEDYTTFTKEVNKLCDDFRLVDNFKCSIFVQGVVSTKDAKIRRRMLKKLDCHQTLPSPAGIFAKLNGGIFFSKIALCNAYLQISVEEEGSKLWCLNKHRKLYKFERLHFGVKVTPAILQWVMDTMLSGLDFPVAYLDDILMNSESVVDIRITPTKFLLRYKTMVSKLKRPNVIFFSWKNQIPRTHNWQGCAGDQILKELQRLKTRRRLITSLRCRASLD